MASDAVVMASFVLPVTAPYVDPYGSMFWVLLLIVLGFAMFHEEDGEVLAERMGRVGWALLAVVVLVPVWGLFVLLFLGNMDTIGTLAFQLALCAGLVWIVSYAEPRHRSKLDTLRPLADLFANANAGRVASVTVMPLFFRTLGYRMDDSSFALLEPGTWEHAFKSQDGPVLIYLFAVRGLVMLRPPMNPIEWVTMAGSMAFLLM